VVLEETWILQDAGEVVVGDDDDEPMRWAPGDTIWLQWPGVHDRQRRVYVGTYPRLGRNQSSWAVLWRPGNACRGVRSDTPFIVVPLSKLVRLRT
jgi:hypothetical protein